MKWTSEIENWLRNKFSYNSLTGVVTNNDTEKEAGGFDIDTGYRSICFSNTLFRGQGYERYTIGTHRLAWFLFYGTWPLIIDHINLIKNDNRISNLREVTNAQNRCNVLKQSTTCHSSFKGVTWHSRDKKWVARIMRDGIRLHLGNFDSEIEAAKAYKKAALSIHKEYAPLFLQDEINIS